MLLLYLRVKSETMMIISLPRFENDSLVNLGTKGNLEVQFWSFVSDCQNIYDDVKFAFDNGYFGNCLCLQLLCNNGGIKVGLATLNSNNFLVYGQKHKVWVLVFLE